MKRGIFILKNDNDLEDLIEDPFETEDLLQFLLERYPNLFSGSQEDPYDPLRWLMVRREARLPNEGSSGRCFALEHLLFDHNAIPTLVEVKRCSDTSIRREVVGQILDYASNAVTYLPVERMTAHFEEQF